MRTIIIVQKVEVHGWLLSGSEELSRIPIRSRGRGGRGETTFLTLVANK